MIARRALLGAVGAATLAASALVWAPPAEAVCRGYFTGEAIGIVGRRAVHVAPDRPATTLDLPALEGRTPTLQVHMTSGARAFAKASEGRTLEFDGGGVRILAPEKAPKDLQGRKIPGR